MSAAEGVPERIGNYRIVRPLGEGGMGVVFEGVHEHIGQRAAVKLLRPEHCRDAAVVQRFFTEARAASRVPHPSLVKIFDFGVLPDGRAYILMEHLAGESLYGRLRRTGGRLEPALALRLIRQLAVALAAVHEAGIIHRDLKPANVFVVPDPEAEGGERVKILDFGVAKIHDGGGLDQPHHTSTGVIVGTPVYMAPEQCRGSRAIDDKADVYALGVMLYQMLAGRPPFEGPPGELIVRHVTQPPPPLPALKPSPPAAALALLGQMLAKDPQQRPSMRQIEVALATPLRGPSGLQPQAAPPAPDPAGPQTTLSIASGQVPSGRLGWPQLLSGALLVAAAVIALALVSASRPAAPPLTRPAAAPRPPAAPSVQPPAPAVVKGPSAPPTATPTPPPLPPPRREPRPRSRVHAPPPHAPKLPGTPEEGIPIRDPFR